MSELPGGETRGDRRPSRGLWITAAAVAAVAVVAAVVLLVRGSGGDDAGEAARTAAVTEGLASPTTGPGKSGQGKAGQGKAGQGGQQGKPASSPTAEPTALAPAPAKTKTIRAALKERVDLGGAVDVAITKVESVKGQARGAGEVAGPALRFTVDLRNGTDTTLSSELGLITLTYGPDQTPAGNLSGPGARMFPAKIAPGDTGTGVFVFNVPPSQRDQLQVTFTYSTDAPRVIFTGSMAS